MRTIKPWFFCCLCALLLTQPVFAAPDAAAVFQQRWQQHDQLVASGQASRSWTWGPQPLTGIVQDEYQVPDTLEWRSRNVQYFDKGRMEINDPEGDADALWYVTSGRLPVDLMLAKTRYRPYHQWKDSYITAIGDPDNFPTYLDLQPLYESPGQPRAERLNQPATDMLEPDLSISRFEEYVRDPATILHQGQNGHLVPQAFLDFMNQQGPLLRDGRRVYGRIYEPLYIFGLPVTPAVWVRAQVGGVSRPVLFQVFERRLLSYNPANSSAFQVEMGNVGAHYYDWLTNPDSSREYNYETEDGTRVAAARDPNVIYTLEVDVKNISVGPPGTPASTPDSAVYRIYRSLDGEQTRELRYTGELGPACWSILQVKLLLPHNPHLDPRRIGLLTACAQSPSDARGYGVEIYSSYDGAKTFFFRGSD
jgi:hypothetical protein